MRIVLIGSGNVATHLGHALKKAGENIIQVWSRSMENASALAFSIDAEPVDDLEQIDSTADLYIISVIDDAIAQVSAKLPVQDKVVVHTSGSTGMEVLNGVSAAIGVLYPLQTFSKSREVNMMEVPIAIEANSEDVLAMLKKLASKLSGNVLMLDSIQRRALHVSAVFACNFTNHLYALAASLLERNNLDFALIRPLISETAEKIQSYSPKDVQTGPAVRNDQQTMQKHVRLLEDDPELREIYEKLSQSIVNLHK